jgi:hypothetical protein
MKTILKYPGRKSKHAQKPKESFVLPLQYGFARTSMLDWLTDERCVVLSEEFGRKSWCGEVVDGRAGVRKQ